MVYYKLIKVTINTLSFAEIIINIIIKYYHFSNLIVINKMFLLTLKFWLSLYYFLASKKVINRLLFSNK